MTRPTIDMVMQHYNDGLKEAKTSQDVDDAYFATLRYFKIRTWDDIEYPNVIEDADKDTCYRCKESIPRDEEFQASDNGLELDFRGGYGEFIDNLYTVTRLWLCHECGHALGRFLGLDVHNWHTHRTNSGQHADHHDRA